MKLVSLVDVDLERRVHVPLASIASVSITTAQLNQVAQVALLGGETVTISHQEYKKLLPLWKRYIEES